MLKIDSAQPGEIWQIKSSSEEGETVIPFRIVEIGYYPSPTVNGVMFRGAKVEILVPVKEEDRIIIVNPILFECCEKTSA